jgi:WD40 repeat protein
MLTRLLPNTTMVACGAPDGTLTVYDQTTSQIQWSQQIHNGTILALEWSPDGAWLASGGQDGLVHLFQVASGLCCCSFDHGHAVERLDWSPESQHLCVASGQTLHLLRITSLNNDGGS